MMSVILITLAGDDRHPKRHNRGPIALSVVIIGSRSARAAP
jgi:hypothetical protein